MKKLVKQAVTKTFFLRARANPILFYCNLIVRHKLQLFIPHPMNRLYIYDITVNNNSLNEFASFALISAFTTYSMAQA